jgi:hypothetical protein
MSGAADSGAARDNRRIAILIGSLTFVLYWWLWGSWSPQPVGSDEAAYLLQARIFASGRIVSGARPLPEFFWQYHVFVDPVLAAKYPPGHSALLALGELLHAPWLVPLLAASVTSALVFLLTLRWSSRPVAIVAATLAMTSAMSLRFWPSYFSETSTSCLFVVGWLALANYWETGRARWLMTLALAVGLGAITRPLTMLAFALPAACVAFTAVKRHRAWNQLVPAALITLTLVALSFGWTARVTGNWRRSAHAEYARRFIPDDHIGFGAGSRLPADSLPPELREFNGSVRVIHERHTAETIVRTAGQRLTEIGRDTWAHPVLSAILALLAIGALPSGVSFVALATIFCVFAAYLLYAHLATWTLYYLELEAPLAFLTAFGMNEACRRLGDLYRRVIGAGGLVTRPRRLLFAALSVVLIVPSVVMLAPYRAVREEAQAPAVAFAVLLKRIPDARAVVFVRERFDLHPEQSVVQNVADFAHARVLVGHDLGSENARLAALTGRAPYLAVEAHSGDSVEFRLAQIARAAPAEVNEAQPSAHSGVAEAKGRK